MIVRGLLLVAAAAALTGCVASVSASSGGPAPASYRAFNTMLVFSDPTRPATMAVRSQPRAGPKDFWCAAGDFADRFLDTRPTDRIYILRGPGPSPDGQRTRAVTFTTQPPPDLAGGPRPGEGGNYSLRLNEPGFNVQAAQARSFCVESRRKFAGIGLF